MEKKSWIIEEQFVGWGHATVWAETEEEAMRLYKLGEYDDYEFCSINEENETFIDINNTGGKY